MTFKRAIILILALGLLLVGCGNSRKASGETPTTAATAPAPETAAPVETTSAQIILPLTIRPLPDATMDNLTDAILAVSLEEGKAYVDDSGKMQMDLKIYSYDRYDMVEIASLQEGDIIAGTFGETVITGIERGENGTVHINGGLEGGGFDLVTEDGGIYFEAGYNDHKNWHQVGEATIRVSADLEFVDRSDLEKGEQVFFAGSFLVGEVTNYDFTPYNTTIRVEGGQVVEMTRRYIP